MISKRTPISSSFSDAYEAESLYLDAALEHNKSFVLEMGGRDHAMQKTASMDTHIPPELETVIRDVQAAPDPSMAYLYDRALGAGEHYGANNNGDWFGRDELKKRHGTFKSDGALYRHHKSDGPKVGDVLASAYNDKLDTVDLILRAPLTALQDDLEKLESGGVIATSMGARVPHDICSYCGNKARNRAMYCDHLKHQMLKIHSDGRQVFAINPEPLFKDISIVVIQAAPESVVLRKIANLQQIARQAKTAEMEKEVGSANSSMYSGEGRDVLDEAAIDATNHMDREDALQTLHEASGPLRPDEFQAVLQKDASCLRPDIVPYVSFEKTAGKKYLGGKSMSKVAGLIKQGVYRSLEKNAQLHLADFLDRHEKIAYLKYRKATSSDIDRRFLR